jgi:hypothetical protein
MCPERHTSSNENSRLSKGSPPLRRLFSEKCAALHTGAMFGIRLIGTLFVGLVRHS